MATWFEIVFTGEPTEADFERVAELARQGYTSGQLINEDEDTEPGEDPEPEFSWTAVSAVWQAEHGEAGTARTESALAYLRALGG